MVEIANFAHSFKKLNKMKKLFTTLTVFAALTLSAQTNLVTNPGFETWADGKPTDWFVPTGATLEQSTTAHGGTSSVGVPAREDGNYQISPFNDIPVTQGVTYVFSGWYLDNTPEGRFRYWAQFRTAAGSGGSDTGPNPLQMEGYSTDSPEWVFFTAEGVPNSGATVIRAGLRVYNDGDAFGGIVLLDDIMVYDKSTMAVSDVNDFDKQVQMNTVVTNQLTLKLPARATVNIYSIEGKLISSNRVDNNGSINTQSLAKGTYVVTVDNGYNKVSRKIVKK